MTDSQPETEGWPAWKLILAAAWPAVILTAYLARAVLPLLLRLGN